MGQRSKLFFFKGILLSFVRVEVEVTFLRQVGIQKVISDILIKKRETAQGNDFGLETTRGYHLLSLWS